MSLANVVEIRSPVGGNSDAALIEDLKSLLGEDNVITSLEERVFFSTDIYSQGVTVDAVVKPGTTEEVAKAVAICTGHGRAVIPRGGGFSYTGGYVPVVENTVTFDLRRLNKIIEINVEDGYVTTECGVTWKQLYDALKEKGVRTPYFGPMSGYSATVGGALSQGSFFLGSTQYGTIADSVLSLEVVLADGSVIRTGSASSTISQSPFYRWYGPDLTGLFLADTGAMGFKTRASFKLLPFPQFQRYGTFPFETIKQSIAATSEIARRGLAAECYVWDPTFVKGIGQRTNMLQDLKYMAGVVGSGSSWMSGLKDAARIAMAGKKVFDGSAYLLHITIDEVSDAAAEEKLKMIQEIIQRNGGGEIEATAPRTMRGTPFNDPLAAVLPSPGYRNLPTNGLVPHSKAQELAVRIHNYFDEQKPLFDKFGITWGVIVFAVGSTAICIEPLYFWDDPKHYHHDRRKETSRLDELAKIPETPAVFEAVTTLRNGLIDIYTEMGAVHVQIAKSYKYHETRDPQTLALIDAIKDVLDPNCLVNPGSLGFAPRE
jgi:FAD/FMN-containing dehydrogenase